MKATIIIFRFEDDDLGFGLTTYQNTFIDSLRLFNNIDIVVVSLNSTDHDELAVIDRERLKMIYVPILQNKNVLNVERDSNSIVLARRIIQLVYPILKEMQNPIFLLNSMVEINFIDILRNYFDCHILFVVHSIVWKDYLNIPDNIFLDLWLNCKETLPPNLVRAVEVQIELADKCDFVVTVTHHAKKMFNECFNIDENKIRVIYNASRAFPTEKFDKNTVKKLLGFRRKDELILYSGRLATKKGVFVLLEAFRKLSITFPNIRLILMGDGVIRDCIRHAAPVLGRITFTGHLNQEEKQKYYKIASIGVLPSLAEQCSFSAIEMRLNKLPFVTTNIDGNSELFTNGYDAVLIAVENQPERHIKSETLEEALSNLLTNKKLRKALVRNSLIQAKKYFDIDVFGKSYYDLFQHVLSSDRR